MFDSRQYEWADVGLLLNGNDITGIRSVKYSEEIERDHLHAKGRYAHSIQSGNVTVKGEISVLQEELEALINAGGGSILQLPSLTAVVSYGDPANGDTPIMDRIEGIKFTMSEKELKQGDKHMEVKLPFLALRVQHRVV